MEISYGCETTKMSRTKQENVLSGSVISGIDRFISFWLNPNISNSQSQS